MFCLGLRCYQQGLGWFWSNISDLYIGDLGVFMSDFLLHLSQDSADTDILFSKDMNNDKQKPFFSAVWRQQIGLVVIRSSFCDHWLHCPNLIKMMVLMGDVNGKLYNEVFNDADTTPDPFPLWDTFNPTSLPNCWPLPEHHSWVHVCWGHPDNLANFFGNHSELLKIHQAIHLRVISCRMETQTEGKKRVRNLFDRQCVSRSSTLSFLL